MNANQDLSRGRSLAETCIKVRIPDATSFRWEDRCVPPHEDFDFDFVSFRTHGVVSQVRLRCQALDNSDEAEIRAWVAAQTRDLELSRRN
jgi:hypothetical protein